MGSIPKQRPHNDANDVQNPSYSAVLKDIFEQTQSEITERNEDRMETHIGSSVPSEVQFKHLDDTYRFEPLSDPALSYISEILTEDDLNAIDHPCTLSYSEYVAYQATASEMAALLKEDSPALALTVDPSNAVASNDLSESSSCNAASICKGPTYPDKSWTNEILLDSVRGSPSKPAMHSQAQDASSLESPGNELYVGPDRAGSQDDAPSFFNLSCLDVEPSYSETQRNEILLTSLRSASSRSILHTGNTSRAASLPENVILEQSSGQLANLQTPLVRDDTALRLASQKLQGPQKSERLLKPRKQTGVTHKKSGGKGRCSKLDGDQEYVNINDLLLQSAQAVGVNNTKAALEILTKVRKYASPYGTGAQRVAYYFAEAMDARFSGTGWPLYWGLLRRSPSAAEILKATYMYMASCPFVKAYHYFINKTILNVAKKASKLHILELQVTGFQYPSLFKALADRHGGPPQVHLIAIGFPHYSMLPTQPEIILEGVKKTCTQLADYAVTCGVPFQYTAWAGTRDELHMQDFISPQRNDDEVLVVISAYMLRYVMDDTLDSPVKRSRLLREGRSVNPDVYIQGIVTGSYNTPFFTRRFRDALFHFESVFDMLDTFISRENPDRLVFESEILGKAILNIVACEGPKVMERVDKYKQWQAATEEIGFHQLPLDEGIKKNVQVMLQTWHREYTVAEDSQYLLMGWKGRMLHAMSTWKVCA